MLGRRARPDATKRAWYVAPMSTTKTCSITANGQRLDGLEVVDAESVRGSDGRRKALALSIKITVDDPAWRLADKLHGKDLSGGAVVVDFEGETSEVSRLDSDGAWTMWVWSGDQVALRGMRELARSRAH